MSDHTPIPESLHKVYIEDARRRINSLRRLLEGNTNGIGLLARGDLRSAIERLGFLETLLDDQTPLGLVNEAAALRVSHHVIEVETREARKAPEFQRFMQRATGA